MGSASTSSVALILARLNLKPFISLGRTHSASVKSQTRTASSFIPGTAPIDQLPSVPKPPSTNWFTTHPALSDSLAAFDDLIHRSRQQLYQLRVLKRYSAPADFSGTGVRLKWLRWKMEQDSEDPSSGLERRQLTNVLWNSQMKWHELETMGILLQGNEGRQLRMIEYNDALAKLNEMKALKRYLMLVKTLQLSNSHGIDQLDTEIERALLRYSRPERQAHSSKDQIAGRDHLGRFYGIGKKKESTARAWIIEVKVPASSSATATEATLALSSSAKEENSASELVVDEHERQPERIDIPLGKIMVNGRPISDYFYTPRQRATAIRPLEITDSVGHYNVHILTHGGGKMGQAAAIAHAVANALMKALQEAAKTDGTAQERYARKVLAKSMLTLRDPRVVERKKTGKPGAKSSYRWVKR